MANEEHLQIIKQGVDVWNKWREKNPDIKPDLIGGDLSGADLTYAYLNEADLSGANLRGAKLFGGRLRRMGSGEWGQA